MADMKIEPHHIGALTRAKESFQRHADAMAEADPMDYNVEFPSSDAESIQEIINYLQTTPPADAALASECDSAAMGLRQHNPDIADTLNKAAAALRVQASDQNDRDENIKLEREVKECHALLSESLYAMSTAKDFIEEVPQGGVTAEDLLFTSITKIKARGIKLSP